MGYWEDIDRYEENCHKRDMAYLKAKHEYKMKELEKEVELYILKQGDNE